MAALEKAGMRAYVAIPNFDFHDTGLFGTGHLRYDPEKDLYVCPADERLHRRTRTRSNRGTRYRAKAEACNACELKAKCTTSERGRMLYRPRSRRTPTTGCALTAGLSPTTKPYERGGYG